MSWKRYGTRSTGIWPAGHDKERIVYNFWYLFAAYTVIWTALFVYMVYLSRKNRDLRDEIHNLQTRVKQLSAR